MKAASSSLLLFLRLLGLVAASSRKQPPHVFLVVVDDFGWGDVGYHLTSATNATEQARTPTIDALVRDGVELDRHYVHMMCTPSRSALQSGRLPVHVLTQLAGPCDTNGAIPRNVTGIAAQLKKAGYATHQVGKWDAGMATPSHTPMGRGYDSSLSYFGHGNWGWTEIEWGGSENNETRVPTESNDGIVDLWDTDRPASTLNGTGYEEDLFRDRMVSILRSHDPAIPIFLNYNSKLAHYPMQAPIEYQERFSSVQNDNRRLYLSMIAFLDDQLLNVTSEMRSLGLWDNTLMILTSDNGGYVKGAHGECNATTAAPASSSPAASDVGHGTVCFNGEAGATNWPLRGGKYAMFEGGIRVNAFASGGFLPDAVRGTKLEGIIHVADWYGTLCGLAGVDPTDSWAASSGLPPVDSVDVWPMLSGLNRTSPRSSFLVTKDLLIHGEWKMVRGNVSMIESERGGPVYPNASTATDSIDGHSFTCPPHGCLFNVVEDMFEEHEVSAAHPELVATLMAEMDREAGKIWSTSHTEDPACKRVAQSKYGNFYGPFREIDEV